MFLEFASKMVKINSEACTYYDRDRDGSKHETGCVDAKTREAGGDIYTKDLSLGAASRSAAASAEAASRDAAAARRPSGRPLTWLGLG